MTKKKSPTPAKVATRKKESKPTWKQTGEASIPGIGTIKNFSVKFDEDTKPSAQDILDAVTAENYALKTLLSKHQSKDMPQNKSSVILAQPSPTLETLLGEMDKELSRFFNGMNALDSFADRLKSSPVQGIKGETGMPAPSDFFGRLDNLLGTFNHLNNRLQATNGYLGEII